MPKRPEPAGTITVPTILDEITPAWLSGALGTVVEEVDVHQIGQGEGFLGQLARVKLRGAPDLMPSVIVKLPTVEPGARAIGEMMGVWEREHGFYRDVAPSVTVRVPKAFHNTVDPPCLILEDLAPGQPGDHVAGATLDQAERAVDAIAIHHGTWFDHAALGTLSWLPGLDDPSALSLGTMFEVGWPTFLERYGDELPSRCLAWCERFARDIPAWLGAHSDLPCTMTHGDFRLDNIFYFDDGSVALIDWQMSMRAPGQADLVYFCANNLSVEMRRGHETALIQRYVEGLHRAGVPQDAVTVPGVTFGYLEGLMFYATTFAASLLGIEPSNERGTRLFDALVHRTFAAVDDLDVGTALGL
jgi:hypothetical protein